jgi:hypothetical protein
VGLDLAYAFTFVKDIPVDDNRRFGPGEPGQGKKGTCFSRSIGADKGYDFSLVNVKRNTVQGFDVSVGNLKVLYIQQHKGLL